VTVYSWRNARLVVAYPLPNEVAILPTVDRLQECFGADTYGRARVARVWSRKAEPE